MAIPKPKVFWPLTVGTGNNKIDVFVSPTNYVATVASATYTTAVNYAAAIQTALNSLGGGVGIFAVTVSADGIITISNNAFNFTLKFSTGANAANSIRTHAGFGVVDQASVAFVAAAQYQHVNGWYSPVAVRRDSGDIFEQPNSVMTLAVSGKNKSITEDELTLRVLDFSYITNSRTFIRDEGANLNRAAERWWREGKAQFLYFEDATTELGTQYFLDMSNLEDGFKPERLSTKAIYSFSFKLRKYVA